MFSSLVTTFREILAFNVRAFKNRQMFWDEFRNLRNATRISRGILFQYAGLLFLELDQKLK